MKPNNKNITRLITHTDPRSPVAEAYRTLRTNIQFSSPDKPLKTLLVTGANPGCGKSTTSANLAVALAQAGSAVLLIDTDLRRPYQHKNFGTGNERGLTSLLLDKTLDLNKVIGSTGIPNLDLITSGPLPPNPAELLASAKMKNIVAALLKHYDYIIFDSPPVVAVTDAAVLSQLADAVILVIDHAGVTRDEAAFALEQLARVKANVIGAVINGIPNQKGHYYYNYNYYGEQPGKKSKRKKKAHTDVFTIPSNRKEGKL